MLSLTLCIPGADKVLRQNFKADISPDLGQLQKFNYHQMKIGVFDEVENFFMQPGLYLEAAARMWPAG